MSRAAGSPSARAGEEPRPSPSSQLSEQHAVSEGSNDPAHQIRTDQCVFPSARCTPRTRRAGLLASDMRPRVTSPVAAWRAIEARFMYSPGPSPFLPCPGKQPARSIQDQDFVRLDIRDSDPVPRPRRPAPETRPSGRDSSNPTTRPGSAAIRNGGLVHQATRRTGPRPPRDPWPPGPIARPGRRRARHTKRRASVSAAVYVSCLPSGPSSPLLRPRGSVRTKPGHRSPVGGREHGHRLEILIR